MPLHPTSQLPPTYLHPSTSTTPCSFQLVRSPTDVSRSRRLPADPTSTVPRVLARCRPVVAHPSCTCMAGLLTAAKQCGAPTTTTASGLPHVPLSLPGAKALRARTARASLSHPCSHLVPCVASHHAQRDARAPCFRPPRHRPPCCCRAPWAASEAVPASAGRVRDRVVPSHTSTWHSWHWRQSRPCGGTAAGIPRFAARGRAASAGTAPASCWTDREPRRPPRPAHDARARIRWSGAPSSARALGGAWATRRRVARRAALRASSASSTSGTMSWSCRMSFSTCQQRERRRARLGRCTGWAWGSGRCTWRRVLRPRPRGRRACPRSRRRRG